MRISHSRVELYTLCPAKYKYKYIDGLDVDKTFTPLLFGSAIDKALNYILTRTKHKHLVYSETAIKIFNKNMEKWHGQNELIFFKNECPEIDPVSKGLFEELDDGEKQWSVWTHLNYIGVKMLRAYQAEILPMFKEIVSVQTKKIIPNDDGDELVLITDFMAKLHDDRIVVFDNKTTTDIKKNYGKSSVAKSQQLAIYTEYETTNLAGYIALGKKLKEDGSINWVCVVDEIPEEQTVKAFEKIDEALRGIKSGDFPCKPACCFAFGRKCEYWNLCKFGSMKGLIKKA